MNIAVAHTVIIAALKRNPKGATHAQLTYEVYEVVGYDKSIVSELRDLLDTMCTPPAANIPAEIALFRNDMAVSMRVYKLNN